MCIRDRLGVVPFLELLLVVILQMLETVSRIDRQMTATEVAALSLIHI